MVILIYQEKLSTVFNFYVNNSKRLYYISLFTSNMIKSKIWPRTCFTNQLSVSFTKMKILCIYLIKKTLSYSSFSQLVCRERYPRVPQNFLKNISLLICTSFFREHYFLGTKFKKFETDSK